jgi:hypothetical protein
VRAWRSFNERVSVAVIDDAHLGTYWLDTLAMLIRKRIADAARGAQGT